MAKCDATGKPATLRARVKAEWRLEKAPVRLGPGDAAVRGGWCRRAVHGARRQPAGGAAAQGGRCRRRGAARLGTRRRRMEVARRERAREEVGAGGLGKTARRKYMQVMGCVFASRKNWKGLGERLECLFFNFPPKEVIRSEIEILLELL